MSKAFIKEDHDAVEELPASRSALPPGARNFLTPDGAARLGEELRHLIEDERGPLLAAREEPEAGCQLRRVDLRIHDLTQRLESAEIVHPPDDLTEVQFGATVTVRDGGGEEQEYRIVGPNEVDLEECWISAVSPLARALLGHRAGERVAFAAPVRGAAAGARNERSIVSVSYEGP